ncbi:hypothetical protein JR316_0000361 [Psilocybe cubensis]|uniref:Uncharacterized protein n=2 Tax=Psilocybe cubensis TaxID=181762 RepID=A0ACB8HF62_PSICU|nr:hypothetical protein JR316_0000361 [Psilocybe cubensis]KAH9486297.1 hypothetical protein JR316_0000361 [Psilocybe cubensis]
MSHQYPPKCWGFEDDGSFNGKCRKSAAECRFTHPESADWAKARRLPNQSGHKKSGSFTGSNQGKRDSDYSDAWKTSSDARASTATSTNTTILPESGSRWGKASSTGGGRSEPAGSHASWEKSSGKTSKPESMNKPESSGWGSAVSGGRGNQTDSPAWGKSNSPGWGSPGWGSPGWESGSGWGGGWKDSGTKSNGEEKEKDDGWPGTSTGTENWSEGVKPGSGWGTADGTGAEKTPTHKIPSPHHTQSAGNPSMIVSEDVIMRPPSPKKMLPLPQRSLTTNAKSSKPGSGQSSTNTFPSHPAEEAVNTGLKEHDTDSTVKSSTSAMSRLPIPKIPKKVHNQISSQPENLKDVYKNLVSVKQSRFGTSTSQSYPVKYVGHEGRIALYTDILTYMQDVVIAEIRYVEAKSKYDKWKEYLASSSYSRATPATRKILEGTRDQYFKDSLEAKEVRDAALLKLGNLPDFLPSEPINDPAVTKQIVMHYTNELRSWFLDLKIHERLAIKKQESELKAKELEAQAAMIEAQQQPSAQELLHRGNWNWTDLKAALKLAEDRVTAAEEQVYIKAWTNQDLLDEQFCHLPAVEEPIQETIGPDTRPGTYLALENMLKAVDAHLSAQSIQAGTVIEKVNNLEEEIASLRAGTSEINRVCDEAEEQFPKFEEENTELLKQAESLQAHLTNLHLHRWSGQRSTSPELLKEAVEPILNELLPYFQKRMEDELRGILDLLRQRCLENQAELGRQVEEMLKPLLANTDEIERICKTFMASAQDLPPPIASTSISTVQ